MIGGTSERFKELVPKDIREHYDTRVGDEELYKFRGRFAVFNPTKELEIRTSIWEILLSFSATGVDAFLALIFLGIRESLSGERRRTNLSFPNLSNKPTYYPGTSDNGFFREKQR